jgi:hypothetical protein
VTWKPLVARIVKRTSKEVKETALKRSKVAIYQGRERKA